MRCLYCGKHLPLLRKLRGGGEFCSDAHRDKYHEEYNRLAVSRLLQAQTRVEEPRANEPDQAEQHEEHTGAVAVAVDEEPESDLVSTSLIEEFQVVQVHPVAVPRPTGIDVAPASFESLVPALPSIQPLPFTPRVEGRFLSIRAKYRSMAASCAEPAPPSSAEAQRVSPPALECGPNDPHPADAGRVPLDFAKHPRSSSADPLVLGVSFVELSPSKPVIAHISWFAGDGVLPRAGSREIVLSSTPPADVANLQIELLERFPGLEQFRPARDILLALLDPAEYAASESSESAVPDEPSSKARPQPAEDVDTQVVLITPRKALEALQADRRQRRPPEPPLSRTMKPIAVPSAVPITEALNAGFDSISFAARPRLLKFTTHPLRPKMVIGTAAGPPAASSGVDRPALEAVTPGGNGKNAPARIGRRSMLHLDDHAASDADADSPSLLGKLGGLFGKKGRTGKQEVGSQK